MEELTLGKEGRKEYLIATREIAGKKTTSLLLKLLPLLIKSLVFPKNMFWEKSRIKFPRPIRWLLCLYGDKTVPFSYGELQADRKTWGHRFLAPVSGPIVVSDPSEYFSSLEKSGVIVDQEQRLQLIEEKVSAVAADRQLQADIDPALLEEVSFLVESPEAIFVPSPKIIAAAAKCWSPLCKATSAIFLSKVPRENFLLILLPYPITALPHWKKSAAEMKKC